VHQDHNPYALQKLAAIPAKLRSEDASIWMARMALRHGDWKKLHSAIDSLPDDVKKKDRWRYWRAHSSKRLGDKSANNQLAKIANNIIAAFPSLKVGKTNLQEFLQNKP